MSAPGAMCPKSAQHHQPGIPDGYLERQDWFRAMAKTHQQLRCDACRLFVVWKKKPKCKVCGRRIVNIALHMRRWHGGRP